MIEINNKTRSNIDMKLVRTVCEKFLKYYKIEDKELSLAFIGDKLMHDLNKQYRGKDKTTDILSFCGDDSDLGEIIINYAQIKRQAKKFSANTNEELVFILVHGLLHLLGYEDETNSGKKKMDELGKKFIKLNLKNK